MAKRDYYEVLGVEKGAAEADIKKAFKKKVMEGEDAEKIRARSQDLTEAAMKLGEAIYKAQAAEQQGAEPGDASGGPASDDDVVDADFEDLGDNKKS